ncbi:MAG TPA: hypothetical protein ACHBZ9_02400 [Arsenophonus nasoniae]|uniref:hypothetical protein n=1 Tax=Arsenophonus nasoniae TaxID=638 RepID=UPI003879BD06
MTLVFPKIYSANYATQNGKFFARRGDIWIQIERYLPCATGTLNEPLEVTAHRWLNEFEQGNIKVKRAIRSTGGIKNSSYKLSKGELKCVNPINLNINTN